MLDLLQSILPDLFYYILRHRHGAMGNQHITLSVYHFQFLPPFAVSLLTYTSSPNHVLQRLMPPRHHNQKVKS